MLHRSIPVKHYTWRILRGPSCGHTIRSHTTLNIKKQFRFAIFIQGKVIQNKTLTTLFFLPQCFDLTFFLKCEPCINPARPNEPHAKSKKNWIPSVKMRLTTKKRTAMCLLKLLIACKVSLILHNNNCIKTPSIKQSGLSNPGKKKKEKF